jgi:hypothetical protein
MVNMKRLLTIILILATCGAFGQGGARITDFTERTSNVGDYFFSTAYDSSGIRTNYKVRGKYINKERIDSLVAAVAALGGGTVSDWGDIGGTLSDQADLNTALNARLLKTDTTSFLAAYQAAINGKQASNTLLTQLAAISFSEGDFITYTGGALVKTTAAALRTAIGAVNSTDVEGIVGGMDIDGSQIVDGSLPYTALEESQDLNPREIMGMGLDALGFYCKLQSYGVEWGSFSTENTLADGSNKLVFMNIPRVRDTVNYATVYLSTSGDYTADGENRIGVFSYDTTTQTYTLLGASANNGNLWKASVGFVTVQFTAPVILEAGKPYFVGLLWNNSANVTTPALYGGGGTSSSIISIGLGARITSTKTSSSTMPTSITAASTSSSSQRYWVKLH